MFYSYGKVISSNLNNKIVEYFDSFDIKPDKECMLPERKQLREFDADILFQIQLELRASLPNFRIDEESLRLYSIDKGKILRYKDIMKKSGYDYTLLLYLNDDFKGGEMIFQNNHIIKPVKTYGLVYKKDYIYYTGKLSGRKLTLIIDLMIR